LKGKAILEFTAQHFANLFSFYLLFQVVAGREDGCREGDGIEGWLEQGDGCDKR
jgi:hypothetical protein